MKYSRFIITLTVLFLLGGFIPSAFAQWEPAKRLTFSDTLTQNTLCRANAKCIATSGDTVHIVWGFTNQPDDKEGPFVYGIFYKRSTDRGKTWGPSIQLSDKQSKGECPCIAVSGPFVHVTWKNMDNLFYDRSTDFGATWKPDTQWVFTSCAVLRESPSIAVSGPNVFVFWPDYRGDNDEIYYKHSSDNGGKWSPDIRLTRTSKCFKSFPSVTASGPNIHVVWEDNRGHEWSDHINKGWNLYYKKSTDWGVHWSKDTCLTCYSYTTGIPSIAVEDTWVYIVWRKLNDLGYRYEPDDIYYMRSSNSGSSWCEEPTLLVSPKRGSYFTPSLSSAPSIAVSGSNVHVVWSSDWHPNDGLFYIYSSDKGTTWVPDTCLISKDKDGSYVLDPNVTVSGSSVHILYLTHEIYYKRNPTTNVGSR